MTPFDDSSPIADALRRLSPQPAAFSRDALLFAAGKAAAAPRTPAWFWPSATALFAGVTVVLACFLAFPADAGTRYVNVPQTVYVDRIVEIRVPVPDSSAVPVAADIAPEESGIDAEESRRQWKIRNEVLRHGVEMLPRSNDNTIFPKAPVPPVRPSDRGIFAHPSTPFGIPGLNIPKPKPRPSPFDDVEDD